MWVQATTDTIKVGETVQHQETPGVYGTVVHIDQAEGTASVSYPKPQNWNGAWSTKPLTGPIGNLRRFA